MITVAINKNEVYVPSSKILPTIKEKKYCVTANAKGIEGKPYCAYLGVIFVQNNKEITRQIQWLNDFSGNKKKVIIIFKAFTDHIRIVYRINNETPDSFNCKFELTPIEEVILSHKIPSLDKEESEDVLPSEPEGFSKTNFLENWKKGFDETRPLTEHNIWANLNGDVFVKLANKWNIFSPDKSILELGPGTGRILSSILSLNIPFKSYTAVDISQQNIKNLTEKFGNNNINFVESDFSSVSLPQTYDIMISSSTLKHQYPTFRTALENIQKFVNKDGIFFFDLRENYDSNYYRESLTELLESGPLINNWDYYNNTYVGVYHQNEVKLILNNLSHEITGFDHVIHDEKLGERLVVISRKL